MKAKTLIIILTLAITVPFSLISINNEDSNKKGHNTHQSEPMSGFALEDRDQF